VPDGTKIIVRQTIVERLGVITIPTTSELIIGEDPVGINIDAQGFNVQGNLTAGSETCRIEAPITITLHGARPPDAVSNPREPTYKGIVVTGTLNLHGQQFFRTWTRLARTVNSGDSVLVLQDTVNWQPWQQVVLVTTAIKDSQEWHQNEVMVVANVHPNPQEGIGAVVYLTSGVKYRHVANTGYQGEVGLLTRTIKIQGAAEDSEPSDPDPLNCIGRSMWGNAGQPCPNTELTGFGGHVEVMDSGRGFVEGVELVSGGSCSVELLWQWNERLSRDCALHLLSIGWARPTSSGDIRCIFICLATVRSAISDIPQCTDLTTAVFRCMAPILPQYLKTLHTMSKDFAST
jgi:hypothetical protein